jgi:pyruvate dehydrogenase E2 component (dihydrolipoamide acetyltransferase)
LKNGGNTSSTSVSIAMVQNLPIGIESYEEVPVSQMRKVIAKRLAESLYTAPHFYLTIEVNMDEAKKAREQMNAFSPVKISFNDMVIKACALSLKKHPAVNSSWLGDKIRINHHVNIGMAVAVPDGLVVPVIRSADMLSLSQLAASSKTFAEKAKNKQIMPEDMKGNTFSISNLGMMGIEEFTAIINPPDACIMAVGAMKDIVAVKNGNFVASSVMKLTLSCDHRVVDGAVGAGFLKDVKAFLENPVNMLV